MPVGGGISPKLSFVCHFEAAFDSRLTMSHLINVVLFAAESPVPSTGAGGDYAVGVSVHV